MNNCFVSTFSYQVVEINPQIALQNKAQSLIKQLQRFIELKIFKQFTFTQAKIILQYIFIEVLNQQAQQNKAPPRKQLAKLMQQQFEKEYSFITQKIKEKDPLKGQKLIQKMNQLMSGNQLSFANFFQQQQEIGNQIYQVLEDKNIKQAFDGALARIQNQYSLSKQKDQNKQISINEILNIQNKRQQLDKRFSCAKVNNSRRNFQIIKGVKIYDQSQVKLDLGSEPQYCDIQGIKYYNQSIISQQFDIQNADIDLQDQQMKKDLKIFREQYEPSTRYSIIVQQVDQQVQDLRSLQPQELIQKKVAMRQLPINDPIQELLDSIDVGFKPRKVSYSPQKVKNKFIINDQEKLRQLKTELTLVIITYNSIQTEKLKVFYGESKKELQVSIKKCEMFDINDSRQYWAILMELPSVPYNYNPKQLNFQVFYFYRKFYLFRNEYFSQNYSSKEYFMQTMSIQPKKTLIIVNDSDKEIDKQNPAMGKLMRSNAAVITLYHYLNHLVKQEIGHKYNNDVFAWLQTLFEVISQQQERDKHSLWLDRFIHYPKFINPVIGRYVIYLLESLYPNQREYPYMQAIKSSQFYKEFIIKQKMDRNYNYQNEHHQYLERKYVQWIYLLLTEKCIAQTKKDKYRLLLLDYLQANMELQAGATLASILKETIKRKNHRLISKDLSCINKVEEEIANAQTISGRDYFNIMTYVMFHTKMHQENRYLAIMKMLKVILSKLEYAQKKKLKLFTDISFSEKGLQQIFQDDSVQCVKRKFLFDSTDKFMSFMKLVKKISRKDPSIRESIYKFADRQIINAFNFPYEPEYLLSILQHPTHDKQIKYIEKTLQKYSLKQPSCEKLVQILKVVYLNIREYELDTIQFNNHFSKYWKANQNNNIYILLQTAHSIFAYFEQYNERPWQKELLEGLLLKIIRNKMVLFQYAWWNQNASNLLQLRQDQLKHFGEYVRNNNILEMRSDAISIQLILLDDYNQKDIRIVTLEAYKDQAVQNQASILKKQFNQIWAVMTNYYIDVGKSKLKQLQIAKKNSHTSNRQTGADKHFKDTSIDVMPKKSLQVLLQICYIRFKYGNLQEIIKLANSEVKLEKLRYDQLQNLFNNLPIIIQKLNIQQKHEFIQNVQKIHKKMRLKIDQFKNLSLWQFDKAFNNQNLVQAFFIMKSDSDKNELKQYFQFFQNLELQRNILLTFTQLIKFFHDKKIVEIEKDVQQFIQCTTPDLNSQTKIKQVFEKFKKIELLWIEQRTTQKITKQKLQFQLKQLLNLCELQKFIIMLADSEINCHTISNEQIDKFMRKLQGQNQENKFNQPVVKLLDSLKEVICIVDKFNSLHSQNNLKEQIQQIKTDAKTFLKEKVLPILLNASKNYFIKYALQGQLQSDHVWEVLDDLFVFQINERARIQQLKITERFQALKAAIRPPRNRMHQTINVNPNNQKIHKAKKASSGILDIKSEFIDLNPSNFKEFITLTPGHGKNKTTKKRQIIAQLEKLQKVSEDSMSKIMKNIYELT